MSKFFRHPLFLLGLGIRICLLAAFSPAPVTEWYAPFLETSVDSFSLDPWAVWLAHGGSLTAFPYGYAQWLLFLPAMALLKPFEIQASYGYFTTLLAADAGLLCILRAMVPDRIRLMLFTYWLSPIIILGTYFLGLNDILPIFLLSLAMLSIYKMRFMLSGFFCVCAVSAKLSMLIAGPFFLIYFLRNKATHNYVTRFLQGMLIAAVIFMGPFILFSSAGKLMLLSNPELHKVTHLILPVSQWATIYIVPLAYLIVLYAAWRVKRLNYILFEAILGLAFLTVILLMPASLGWFIWVVPFLALYQLKSDRTAVCLVSAFSLFYLAASLTPLISQLLTLKPLILEHLASSSYTIMAALGIILCLRIWRGAVSRNDFLRLSQKPLVIGIAGDSGAGKDTLSSSLEGLFGGHSVTRLSGDDYHHWDRKKPMWKVMTHLNPMANDLESFSSDLINLIDGKSVYIRHYDHETGSMTKPLLVKSNEIIIVSGLHALYMPILRECYDIGIYLDIDEQLRRYFKIKRDMHQRGHSLEKTMMSIEKREADAERFIRPQSSYAELLLSLQPVRPEVLRDLPDAATVHLKLVVRSRRILYEQTLHRILVGLCGLHVAVMGDGDGILMVIEGDCSAEDIAYAARIVCPNILDFLDINPRWQGGVIGMMQLVVLAHINQSLNKRFL